MKSFASPQDAEAAFYEALQTGDLEAMMEVWADDEEVVCIHPGGPRISGYDRVRESWARILASGGQVKVALSEQVYLQGVMVSLHSVHENVSQGKGPPQAVVTTNVYLRTGGGWRMVVHHASLAPRGERGSRPAAADIPKTLH